MNDFWGKVFEIFGWLLIAFTVSASIYIGYIIYILIKMGATFHLAGDGIVIRLPPVQF